MQHIFAKFNITNNAHYVLFYCLCELILNNCIIFRVLAYFLQNTFLYDIELYLGG